MILIKKIEGAQAVHFGTQFPYWVFTIDSSRWTRKAPYTLSVKLSDFAV
jgi:hypothetical protein